MADAPVAAVSKAHFDLLAQKLRMNEPIGRNEFLLQLRFTQEGLIPAIAQDYLSKQVLMLAWMNDQSIRCTLATGWVTYWSRSRQSLWRKGEQSGHLQKLVEMRCDCDGDSLLCLVKQQGPACHTGRESCFFFGFDNQMERMRERGTYKERG